MVYRDALGPWQGLLRQVLNAYLDGSYLRVRSRWTFPFNWQLSVHAVHDALTDLANVSQGLKQCSGDSKISTFLEQLELALRHLHKNPENTLLYVLTEGYKLLNHIGQLTNHEYQMQTVRVGSEFDANEYLTIDSRYFAPVVKLAKLVRQRMPPYLSMALIHGSIADLRYCKGYTDLDTLLVLNRETVTDPDQLGGFARICYRSLVEFYRFDPLQHHGHMVITDIDLKCYPTNWLPLPTLSTAKIVYLFADNVPVYVRNSQCEARHAFECAVEYFHLHDIRHWTPHSAYDLKYYLSSLMLLPTRYLQAKGIFCTKRDSFDLAKQSLPNAVWDVMDYATQLRSNWPYVRSGVIDILGRICGLLNVRLTRYVQNITMEHQYRLILSSLSPHWVKQSAELAKRMFDDLYADESIQVPILVSTSDSTISDDGLRLSVMNHPVARTRNEYQGARERYVNQVRNIPGVVVVYEFGSITTPGLSDLDFVVSVSDTVDGFDARLLSIDSLPFWDRSLIMHDAVVVPESQVQFIQEFLIGADLRELWCRDLNSPSQKHLDPQIAAYAKAAKLIEKLFSYRVWFADVLANQVVDARWAIATLKSLVYSVSLVESVTNTTLGSRVAYSQAVNELRAFWFEERSSYRRNIALCSLFLSGQSLTRDLIETLDGFLTTSGWLRVKSTSQDVKRAFPVPQSRICVAFGVDAEQTGDLTIDLPASCSRSVTLPWSFLRTFALYAQCAPDLAGLLTVKLSRNETRSEMAPQTEFERYLCQRARRLEVQTRFLLQHKFWFGSHLPGWLLFLSCGGH